MNTKGYYNYMEEVVKNLINIGINNLDICKCEKCKIDIMAIALNELTPKYVVTKKGLNYTQLNHINPQFEVNVIAVIVKAAKKVGKNPKHEL